jgi:predicted nucleotidyltransferase
LHAVRNTAIAQYLDAIARACGGPEGPLCSLVLFGSAATGGYTPALSDVDVLVVLRDDADPSARDVVRQAVADLESRHGLGKPRGRSSGAIGRALAGYADRVTANVRAFFVCSRADLLSGSPRRILGIPRLQAAFVDRVAVPSIVASAVTVWGEDLLGDVPLPAIRRLDVVKACFGLLGQALFAAAAYPLLPDATKYAMDTLKRSVHSCYFCHHAHAAALPQEVAFLDARDGPSRTLERLLALRREYGPSYGFVLSCVPVLVRLHLRTLRCLDFPRPARRSPATAR